ncbi:MAG TPA: hypothetical protein VFY31_07870 [Macromonas sp.]|nr:hypothetical protein [Macromonas sp.]
MAPATDGFDDAVLGFGLPPEAEALLAEAGRLRGQEPERAMALMMRAQALVPEHPAVLIALYRDHFYGHRYAAARDVARRALVVAARALRLPTNWRHVQDDPLPDADSDAGCRFYLFLLKGYAYLSLRLDDFSEARDALDKLRHLDPDDRVGGALLESVRVRALVGSDPDEVLGEHAFGAAAWVRARAGGALGA